jgi:ABC-2 type transport system permease protein
MFYPGSIRKSADSQFDFQPLVSLGVDSGATPWERLTQTPEEKQPMYNPRTGEVTVRVQAASNQITQADLIVVNPTPQTSLDDEDHVVAARISGTGEQKIDVVFIADLDFVSELADQQSATLEQRLDNLALLQNAIEVLAGNQQFVSLRNRRTKPRSLEKLENVFEQYRVERANKQAEAETEMREQLATEEQKLGDAAKEIQANESLSFFEKIQRTSQEATDAQKRFDLRKRKLERNLSETISSLETEEQKRISYVENWTRYTSILTAPIPALALGFLVLSLRYFNEQKNITPERKV